MFQQNGKKAPSIHLAGTVVLVALLLAGCAGTPSGPPLLPVLFPPPPVKARVQYLGAISSPDDLPHQRGGLAEFILGPPEAIYVPVKPIAATLVGERLYICDTVLNSVLVYDLVTGDAHPLLGDRGIGKIKQPNNIASDDEGRLYVADKLRQAVLVFGPDEGFIDAWGRPGEVAPVDMAVSKDLLYVCDMKDKEIEVWNRADGSYIRSIGGQGSEPGRFQFPSCVSLDADGNLYVTDTGNFRVQKLSPSGEPLLTVGGFGTELGRFSWPKGMDVDGAGRIYVADSRFANVQIFNPQGKLLLFFGGPGPDRGNLDLPAGLHLFPWPSSIPWFADRLLDGFDPEFLVLVVSQQGDGLINFFAVARDTEEAK